MTPAGRTPDHYFRTEHLQAVIAGRAAGGGLVTIVSHGVKFVLRVIATAVMARLLTPQDYGLVAMVAVVMNFVSMFKDLGYPSPRSKSRDHG